jgi:serine/tyrosine/threonine adenylyltransferase
MAAPGDGVWRAARYVKAMAPYRPDPLYAALGPGFADPVRPARFPQAILRWRHQRWAQAVGLGDLDGGAFEAHFARFEPLPANQPQPLAMRYHGHQFRTYNPEIGDGRGFLFAQLRDGAGRLLDLATKGSGQTPYSRFGDGRLTLKGGVREVLASAMLEAQGVYTSKAFALFETGEALTRNDEPSPTRASVLTRLGHSHIRFGTFQRLAFHEDASLMNQLIAHCGQVYDPAILTHDDAPARAAALLESACAANARLAAQWMAAGFVHGVLNTDNMVITGESFDYGPWRFLPRSDPSFTAAYFDHQGLYCFARQPEAVGWNLAQLAGALSLVCPDEAALEAILRSYAPRYQRALRDAMFARLALAPGDLAADLEALGAFFTWLTDNRAGWAQTFHDWFAGEASADRAAQSPQAGLYATVDFAPIRRGLLSRPPDRAERLAHPYFQRETPFDLVIETVEDIWAAIAAHDDWSRFDAAIAAIETKRKALGLAATS